MRAKAFPGADTGRGEVARQAVAAGACAYRAGMLEPRDMAVPSTPVIGRALFA